MAPNKFHKISANQEWMLSSKIKILSLVLCGTNRYVASALFRNN